MSTGIQFEYDKDKSAVDNMRSAINSLFDIVNPAVSKDNPDTLKAACSVFTPTPLEELQVCVQKSVRYYTTIYWANYDKYYKVKHGHIGLRKNLDRLQKLSTDIDHLVACKTLFDFTYFEREQCIGNLRIHYGEIIDRIQAAMLHAHTSEEDNTRVHAPFKAVMRPIVESASVVGHGDPVKVVEKFNAKLKEYERRYAFIYISCYQMITVT